MQQDPGNLEIHQPESTAPRHPSIMASRNKLGKRGRIAIKIWNRIAIGRAGDYQGAIPPTLQISVHIGHGTIPRSVAGDQINKLGAI